MNETTIDGVATKVLGRHADERGYFMEVGRISTDPFFAVPGVKQISTAIRQGGPQSLTAWHLHPDQYDWWWVAEGDLEVALIDFRTQSPTYRRVNGFRMGDRSDRDLVLKIPAGVAHGYRVRTGPARLVYLTSMDYTPAQELRLDPGDPELRQLYDWSRPESAG